MNDQQSIWDVRYARFDKNNSGAKYDFWLDRWKYLLDRTKTGKVLDIGCGSGFDSQYMSDLGHPVISTDLSKEALRVCRKRVPEVFQLQVDSGKGLPFQESTFRFVIANLSLHYFSRQRTQDILHDVKRCLKKGGILFIRLNSTKDKNYGASGHKEVERHLFDVNGEIKRFFDHNSVNELFTDNWKVHGMEEMSVDRYSKLKILWEVVLEKIKSGTKMGVEIYKR